MHAAGRLLWGVGRRAVAANLRARRELSGQPDGVVLGPESVLDPEDSMYNLRTRRREPSQTKCRGCHSQRRVYAPPRLSLSVRRQVTAKEASVLTLGSMVRCFHAGVNTRLLA